jgi:hypothetical protein
MLPWSDGIHARRFPIVNEGGVAFSAHIGGFIFGLLVARLLARTGQAAPGEHGAPRRRPAGPPRHNRRSQTPVAEMCSGVGSGIVNLVTTYQQ